MKVPPRVAAVAFENKTKSFNSLWSLVSSLQEMPKMVLNVLSLSEAELLQFLTLNLSGFDPGLEAGSRLFIKSNLVI